MSKKESSSTRFKFFSGAIGSVFDKSRRKTAAGDGGDVESGKTDKAAYTRRREQIRRAQRYNNNKPDPPNNSIHCILSDWDIRKHRERKEVYMKSLEDRILDLHDDVALRQEFQDASIENSILKDILKTHNINIPTLSPASQQGNTAIMQLRFGQLGAGELQNALSLPLGTSGESPSETLGKTPSATAGSPKVHPHGLDSIQTGIDFVLQLEKPCLEHTMLPIQAGESHGHALTLQASLLCHAPHFGAESSWAVPAVEFEKLFQLSKRLDLDGEITPVQAWNCIKSHDRFQNLTPASLGALRDSIATKISCFGFGAVIEELDLSDIIDAHLAK
ncbi:hypothetical protein BGW36DRAFT_370541 [Talaromyces proteolyticus]|uniref:BZIP domain-containing protein n=1 Tax=Talaromyces proteolyticus TaxID=1131652 RepID=A0AAD4KZU4_9EURO|nr:uncharacterized protein BGW36DRAFT_370541 [Talaromyces proteolyticus]KAH8704077.1 hypothetical protein BGW36DRAFT_370541 [Talaromyces proteolyticus]